MKFKILFLASVGLALASNMEANEITNKVQITTNIVFSLYKGDVPGPQSEFKSDEEISWGLWGTSTNIIWYRHFPSGNFDLHLFDDRGTEVPKTEKGLAFVMTPQLPNYENLLSKKFAGYEVDDTQGEFRRLCRPDEMFAITNRGMYELEVRMRLCVIMTNNMPDLGAMVDGRNVTAQGLRYISNFGIVTSPPLRVKIIK